MKDKSTGKDPTILEAVDNLSSMAELDLEEVSESKKSKDSSSLRLMTGRWLDVKDEKKTVASVKNTFKVVHEYLKHVYSKENQELKEKEVQKGVRSIIALANEAAQKIDQCTELFQNKGSIKESKEYTELMEFYEKKILKRFEEVMASEEEWEEELAKEEDAADIKRRGIKDLESVTRDRDYELFHIVKEDGSKFYNKNLIRHIRLVADFDQIIGDLTGDDPLIKIKVLLDRGIFDLASFIKGFIQDEIDSWIEICGKFRDDSFIQNTYRFLMALFLASNPKNLLTEVNGKGCSSYFSDFQYYLRIVVNGVDYQKILENPSEEPGDFYEKTVQLIHKVCYAIFIHPTDYSEGLALLTRIVEKDGSKEKTSKRSSMSIWNHLLDYQEHLHNELKAYPSGPLFKILDILHMEKVPPFDPYIMDDRASHLFTVEAPSTTFSVLRFACPIIQSKINHATIIPEFNSFLRYAKTQKERWLIVDLQDRTSWKEFARCQVIEDVQKNAEFKDVIDVITLPKHTNFYLQSEDYLSINSAEDFKKLLLEQIKSREECGYYFPKSFQNIDINTFAKQAIATIHELFFGKKKVLSRKNRLDFIEIFYYFLIIRMVKELKSTHLVFLAKDTVDIAASDSAGMYAFLKLFSRDSEWKEEEKDFLTSLFFLPALLIRERPIDIKPFNRTISMIAVISAELELDPSKVKKAVTKLLPIDLSKTEITRAFTFKRSTKKRGRRRSS